MIKQEYRTQNYLMRFVKHAQAFNSSFITTPDNFKVFFKEYGNPNGETWVFLHGGPGGSVNPIIDLSFFDLAKKRVIMLDQRHCGSSMSSMDWKVNNTTELLVNDLELLREKLGLEKWNLYGGSWGSCLGLVYAIKYPQRVEKQAYWGILLGRKSCVNFIAPELLSPMEKFYCDNNFFLEEDFILKNIEAIKDKNILIVHGNDDFICSKNNAIELAKHLNDVSLSITQDEEHNPFSPEMFKIQYSYINN